MEAFTFHIAFRIRNYLFEGLKFKETNIYPWKNKYEENSYKDKLIEVHTNDSREEYKKLIFEQCLEEVHIKASKMFFMKYASLLFFIMGILTIENSLSSIIFLNIGLISLFIFLYLKRKVYRMLPYIEMNDYLVDFLFDGELN